MLKIKLGSRLILAMLFVMAAIYAASGSSKRKIVTPKDYPAGRPYSAGIQVADTLYVSGQTGTDAKTGQRESAEYVDDVMLISQNRGQADQCEPDNYRSAEEAAGVAQINIGKQHPERGVQ